MRWTGNHRLRYDASRAGCDRWWCGASAGDGVPGFRHISQSMRALPRARTNVLFGGGRAAAYESRALHLVGDLMRQSGSPGRVSAISIDRARAVLAQI